MPSTVGRLVVAPLTNKSGGAVAYGDVVIADAANDSAFTTTTTAAITSAIVGVVVEPNGIANNSSGRVQFQGLCPQVNLNASATRGYFIKTHTVAKQGTSSSSRVTGSFGQAMTTSATPIVMLWGWPDGSAASGNVAADAIWDAAGDLAQGTGADTASRLAAGTAGYVLTAAGAASALSWQAPLPIVPVITQHVTSSFNTGTSFAFTVAASAAGIPLICILGSTGRGANSITQTNVTWTNRYTANGNSRYVEIWTGVASGTTGTTATVAYTGSNDCGGVFIELPSTAPAFTTAAAHATSTGASGTVYNTETAAGSTTVLGDYYVWACTAGQASSYSILSQPYLEFNRHGGYFRAGLFRSYGGPLTLTGINVTSNAFKQDIVKIS